MPGPMHRVRIVDLTQMISGPLATMLLEVIIGDGETVTVSAGEGGLIINGVQAQAA